VSSRGELLSDSFVLSCWDDVVVSEYFLEAVPVFASKACDPLRILSEIRRQSVIFFREAPYAMTAVPPTEQKL
jgi:hypothetical protein